MKVGTTSYSYCLTESFSYEQEVLTMTNNDLAYLGLFSAIAWIMCYWLVEKEVTSYMKRFSETTQLLAIIPAILLAPLLAIGHIARLFVRKNRHRTMKR